MFLEHYKLEFNPFERNHVRPRFDSHSGRHALLRFERLLEGRIHCLFLSGAAGIGKSTLAGRRLRGLEEVSVCWIRPGLEERAEFLRQLLRDLGLTDVEGSLGELRNIVEVFLRHEAGQNRRSILVADGLERLSVPILREIEWLLGLRLRNRPVMDFVLLTRNEDLVTDLMPQESSGQLAPYVHQRLSGFELDETRSYLRACLRSAGCDWAEELIPDDVVIDIQAFTRGIVGDINALCFEALNLLAANSTDKSRQPRLSRTWVKEAGSKLRLKYDPVAWQRVEEALSAESVQQTDPNELEIVAARLFVTSGGRTVAEVSLNRPRMVLGRDSGCDISLDSSYVSRFQNLFMETPEGWVVIDLNSTNGCFVNGRRIHEHRLRDGDIIAVGHHQLSFMGAASGALSTKPSGGLISSGQQETTASTADTLVSARILEGS